MGMEWAWLLPTVTVGAAAVVSVAGRYLPGRGALLSIAAIATAFGLFWPVMADLVDRGAASFQRTWFDAGDVAINLGMRVDELAVVMLGLVTAIALAVQVYSIGYMRGEPRYSWYFAVHSLFAAAMLGLVLVDNLLVFYVVWELVGLGSFLLIGFWYERRSAAEAAKKAFITTRVGDVALLIGILVLFKETGTFEMSEIFSQARSGELGQTTINLTAALLLIGAMGKSAQVPFHVWLPDAMEGPTPVSALIHAATMVAAGVYLVARLFPLFVLAPDVLDAVAVIGLLTAFLGAFLALAQNDIKRVLAYSTVSQLGFMFLALGSLGPTAAIFHLLTHGFFKALLFLGAGNIIKALHEEHDLRRMGGLWNRLPATWVAMTVGGFALAGLYPMSGFFSKDEVLSAALDGRNAVWFTAGLAASVLTVLYVGRLLVLAFAGRPRSAAAAQAREAPPVMSVPVSLLVVPAAGLGLIALPWGALDGIDSFLVIPPLPAGGYEFEPRVFWPSLLLTYAAAVLARALYFRREGPAPSWVAAPLPALYRLVEERFYFDHVYQWTVDHVVLAFSRLVALFDRVVVNEGAVDGTGRTTRWSGLVLRYHETGLVSSYVLTIAVTAFVIVLVVITTL